MISVRYGIAAAVFFVEPGVFASLPEAFTFKHARNFMGLAAYAC